MDIKTKSMKQIKLLLILISLFNQTKAQSSSPMKDYSILHFVAPGLYSKYGLLPSASMSIQMGQTVVGKLSLKMHISFKLFSSGRISIITVCGGADYIRPITKQVYIDVEQGKEYYLFTYQDALKLVDSIEFKKHYLDKQAGYSVVELVEDIQTPIGEIKEKPIGFRSGTAFMINNQGYMVTNYHVIENAKKIVVKGLGGDFSTDYGVEVVAIDPSNDLAMLKIKNQMLKFDSVPFLFKSQQAEQGENVFALGYPLTGAMGEEIKVTDGLVSSKSGYKGSSSMYQLSVPIQPGNSGSPLFDANGNLIGIMNAVLKDADNASYAIKVNYLKLLMEMNGVPEASSKKYILKGKDLPAKVTELKKYVFIVTAE